MKFIFPIAATVVALGIFLFLTHPLELREHRRLKIGVSLGLVFFLAGGGLITLLSIVFLGFLWCGNVAWFGSGCLTGFLHRDIRSGTGMRPHFRFAHNHRRDGEREEAIAATKHELEKDPKNFEGLMLLAGIYQDMNLPKEAMPHLEIILNNPDSSESQLQLARVEMDNCERAQRHLEAVEIYNKNSSA